MSETQYFLHLSHRLGYVSDSQYQILMELVKVTFRCLHGLIQAIERESTKPAKGGAIFTSALILSLARLTTLLAQ